MPDDYFDKWVTHIKNEAIEVVDDMFEGYDKANDKVITSSYTYTGISKGYIKLLKDMIDAKAWYDYHYFSIITYKTKVDKLTRQKRFTIDIYLERNDEYESEDE